MENVHETRIANYLERDIVKSVKCIYELRLAIPFTIEE
jgi:hypothetical protein